MPKTPQELLFILDELGISNQTTDHAPVMTVAESQNLRGLIPGHHSKNLFLKDKKGQLWLVVADEEQLIDLKLLRKQIGAANLSFAKADLLMDKLGVTPGSVTPFSIINDPNQDVQVVLDTTLASAEQVSFHPLINTQSTTLSGTDLLRFLRAYSHEPMLLDFKKTEEFT